MRCRLALKSHGVQLWESVHLPGGLSLFYPFEVRASHFSVEAFQHGTMDISEHNHNLRTGKIYTIYILKSKYLEYINTASVIKMAD